MVLSQLQTHEASIVSSVIPKRNWRSSGHQSIWYFLRQNYPHKELIIVDEGIDSVADLIWFEALCDPGSNRGPRQLLEDADLRDWLTSAACDYDEQSWPRTTERPHGLRRSLETHNHRRRNPCQAH